MESKEFNEIIESIKEGNVIVPSIGLTNESDHSGCFEGVYKGEQSFKVNGVDIYYNVDATQYSQRVFAGDHLQPEEWEDGDPEIEIEITGIGTDVIDSIEITGKQKEKLELLISEKTEIE